MTKGKILKEKLLNCTGRELRRALFSLKQIFQDDKDLVHEFVSADGLACLIKVGAEADQNYQNYILRALGQVMLYVDGMNGVIEHGETIQWLYSLITSKFRLVVKTSLKLLLVFIEYTETNVELLVKAIKLVDKQQGQLAWSNLVTLIKDDSQDSEVLIYAMTLVNKTLNGIPDQDTFYDVTDALEEQKIEAVAQKFMNRRGADLDLIEQFRIYEMSLKNEDGDSDIPIEQHRNLRKNRRSAEPQVNGKTPRKSKRSTSTLQPTQQYILDTSQEESTEPNLANESENTENGDRMTPYRRRRERRRRPPEEPPSPEPTPNTAATTTPGEESLFERRQRIRQRAQQKQEDLIARNSSPQEEIFSEDEKYNPTSVAEKLLAKDLPVCKGIIDPSSLSLSLDSVARDSSKTESDGKHGANTLNIEMVSPAKASPTSSLDAFEFVSLGDMSPQTKFNKPKWSMTSEQPSTTSINSCTNTALHASICKHAKKHLQDQSKQKHQPKESGIVAEKHLATISEIIIDKNLQSKENIQENDNKNINYVDIEDYKVWYDETDDLIDDVRKTNYHDICDTSEQCKLKSKMLKDVNINTDPLCSRLDAESKNKASIEEEPIASHSFAENIEVGINKYEQISEGKKRLQAVVIDFEDDTAHRLADRIIGLDLTVAVNEQTVDPKPSLATQFETDRAQLNSDKENLHNSLEACSNGSSEFNSSEIMDLDNGNHLTVKEDDTKNYIRIEDFERVKFGIAINTPGDESNSEDISSRDCYKNKEAKVGILLPDIKVEKESKGNVSQNTIEEKCCSKHKVNDDIKIRNSEDNVDLIKSNTTRESNLSSNDFSSEFFEDGVSDPPFSNDNEGIEPSNSSNTLVSYVEKCHSVGDTSDEYLSCEDEEKEIVNMGQELQSNDDSDETEEELSQILPGSFSLKNEELLIQKVIEKDLIGTTKNGEKVLESLCSDNISCSIVVNDVDKLSFGDSDSGVGDEDISTPVHSIESGNIQVADLSKEDILSGTSYDEVHSNYRYKDVVYIQETRKLEVCNVLGQGVKFCNLSIEEKKQLVETQSEIEKPKAKHEAVDSFDVDNKINSDYSGIGNITIDTGVNTDKSSCGQNEDVNCKNIHDIKNCDEKPESNTCEPINYCTIQKVTAGKTAVVEPATEGNGYQIQKENSVQLQVSHQELFGGYYGELFQGKSPALPHLEKGNLIVESASDNSSLDKSEKNVPQTNGTDPCKVTADDSATANMACSTIQPKYCDITEHVFSQISKDDTSTGCIIFGDNYSNSTDYLRNPQMEYSCNEETDNLKDYDKLTAINFDDGIGTQLCKRENEQKYVDARNVMKDKDEQEMRIVEDDNDDNSSVDLAPLHSKLILSNCFNDFSGGKSADCNSSTVLPSFNVREAVDISYSHKDNAELQSQVCNSFDDTEEASVDSSDNDFVNLRKTDVSTLTGEINKEKQGIQCKLVDEKIDFFTVSDTTSTEKETNDTHVMNCITNAYSDDSTFANQEIIAEQDTWISIDIVKNPTIDENQSICGERECFKSQDTTEFFTEIEEVTIEPAAEVDTMSFLSQCISSNTTLGEVDKVEFEMSERNVDSNQPSTQELNGDQICEPSLIDHANKFSFEPVIDGTNKTDDQIEDVDGNIHAIETNVDIMQNIKLKGVEAEEFGDVSKFSTDLSLEQSSLSQRIEISNNSCASPVFQSTEDVCMSLGDMQKEIFPNVDNFFHAVNENAIAGQGDFQNIKSSLELPKQVNTINNRCHEKLYEEHESVEKEHYEGTQKKKSPEPSLFQVAEKISHVKRNAILDDMQDILLLLSMGDSSFGSIDEKEETCFPISDGTLLQRGSEDEDDDDADCTEKDVGDDQFDTDMDEIEIDKMEEKILEAHIEGNLKKKVTDVIHPQNNEDTICLNHRVIGHVDSSESTSLESTGTSSFQSDKRDWTDLTGRSYKTHRSGEEDDLLKLLSAGFSEPPKIDNQHQESNSQLILVDDRSINSYVIHNNVESKDDVHSADDDVSINPNCSDVQQCDKGMLQKNVSVDCNLNILKSVKDNLEASCDAEISDGVNDNKISVEAGVYGLNSSTSHTGGIADQDETKGEIEKQLNLNVKVRVEKLKSKMQQDEEDEVLKFLTSGVSFPDAVEEDLPFVPVGRRRWKWQYNEEESNQQLDAKPALNECKKYFDQSIIKDESSKLEFDKVNKPKERIEKKKDERKIPPMSFQKKKPWKEQLEEEVITVKTIQIKKAKKNVEKIDSELLKILKDGAITDQMILAEKLNNKRKVERRKKQKEEEDALAILKGGLEDFVVHHENLSSDTAECLEEQTVVYDVETNAKISDNEGLSNDESFSEVPCVKVYKEQPKTEEELLLAMLSSGPTNDQEYLAVKIKAKEKEIQKRKTEEEDLFLLLSQGNQDLATENDFHKTKYNDDNICTDPAIDEKSDIDQKDIDKTTNESEHVNTTLQKHIVNEENENLPLLKDDRNIVDESDRKLQNLVAEKSEACKQIKVIESLTFKKEQIVKEDDIVALLRSGFSSSSLESETHQEESSEVLHQNGNLKKSLAKENTSVNATSNTKENLSYSVSASSKSIPKSNSNEEDILSLLKAGFSNKQLAEVESEIKSIENRRPRRVGKKIKTKEKVGENTILKAAPPNSQVVEIERNVETEKTPRIFRRQNAEEFKIICQPPLPDALEPELPNTVSNEDADAVFPLLKSENEPAPIQSSMKHNQNGIDIAVKSLQKESSKIVSSDSNLLWTVEVRPALKGIQEDTSEMIQDMHLESQVTDKDYEDLGTLSQNTWWSETADSPQCSPYKTFSPSEKLYNNWWSMHHVKKSHTTIKEEPETDQSQETQPKGKVLSFEPNPSNNPSCDTTISEEPKDGISCYRARRRNQENGDEIMALLMHGDSTSDANKADSSRSKDEISKSEVTKDDSINSRSIIKNNISQPSCSVVSGAKTPKKTTVVEKKNSKADDEDDILKLLSKGDLSPPTMITTHTEELVPYSSRRWRPRFPKHKATSDTDAGDEESHKQEVEGQLDEGYDTLPKQINGETPKAETDSDYLSGWRRRRREREERLASLTTVTTITPRRSRKNGETERPTTTVASEESSTVTALTARRSRRNTEAETLTKTVSSDELSSSTTITPRRSRNSEEIEVSPTPVSNEVKSIRRRRRRHEGSDSTDSLSTTTTECQPDPEVQQTPIIEVQTLGQARYRLYTYYQSGTSKASMTSQTLLAPDTLPNGIASRRRRSKQDLDEASEKERRREKDIEKEECSLSSCSSLSSLNKEAGDRSSCASSISIESTGSNEKVPLHSSQKVPSSPSEPPANHLVQSSKTNPVEDTRPGQCQVAEPVQSGSQRLVNGPQTPQSAGLSDTKRYILDMTYTTASPTPHSRKVSTCLHNSPSIIKRMESLKSPSTPLSPQQIEVLNNSGKVQSVQEKLQSQSSLEESTGEEAGRRGDVSGAISQAIQGLSRANQPGSIPEEEVIPNPQEVRKKEWEKILHMNKRELRILNWDFTDLSTEDDEDILDLTPMYLINGIPPPPPPVSGAGGIKPAPMFMPPPPPVINCQNSTLKRTAEFPNKKKKTVRLHWKEANLEHPVFSSIKEGSRKGTIWETLSSVKLDCDKLEHLFESRTKDLPIKEQKTDSVKKNVITVLDHKRSNAINIGLTVLPQPRTIKQAILNMDSVAINKEGVEKLLTLVPSDEEIKLIQDAKAAHPDVPLGSAEQFLITMSSVSGLKARLNLWLFKMDYETLEQEVAEPLADLKQGIEDLKSSKTLKYILATLLAIGNFLNGVQAKGFNIEYLARVPEVKDTVHKQSLLHHLCSMVMEKFPDGSDLYSELASISRCSKVDFEALADTLERMEIQCKQSWEHLRVISKHDSHSQLKNKLQEFLADSAQRIIVLKIVHRRVINRFNKLLLYCGFTPNTASDMKVNEFCKVLSEFALEYRTARERVQEQEKKKENHRKRNKTRGKMIVEKFTGKDKEEDAKLQKLLKGSGTTPGDDARKARSKKVAGRHSMPGNEEPSEEQGDEMMDILVKSATAPSNRPPRERKRTRHGNRKSLRRTLKGGLSEEEAKALGIVSKHETMKV
ncbi:uncharacterized protein LOC117113154 isoform X4 [Anneissia japonica]|uniref:uncharacterized protein LOC117113154 isoform X4 n=1 Tax=Anneissia japonica TaxID=1529436 RepID=UPI001425A6CC|nr:uncharacterized protein LOC117113154 isoform X4 [Anneissia japonica]